jgi:hypothetical protein
MEDERLRRIDMKRIEQSAARFRADHQERA